MRGVTRFRSLRFRSFVMPLLLAALVLRVLIPTRCHADARQGGGMTLESSLCSTGPDRSELIEIPADSPRPIAIVAC